MSELQENKWVWMPHAGHFIAARHCIYHLTTYVGKYIVSTVGEYMPDSNVREILAETRGIVLEGKGDERYYSWLKKAGYQEIGFNRTYETMVFNAKPNDEESSCCPWVVDKFTELDMQGYNDPNEAYAGHLELCRKWAKEGQ